MKKSNVLLVLLMGLMFVFSLTACGSNEQGESSALPSESSSESSGTSSAAPENPVSSAVSENTENTGGTTLVVYFSASGHTETAANYIAAATGGDVFEPEPVEPYTDEDLNYSDSNSRVVYEYENPDARDIELVAATVDNWDAYDTVFIGYPKIQYGFLSV